MKVNIQSIIFASFYTIECNCGEVAQLLVKYTAHIDCPYISLYRSERTQIWLSEMHACSYSVEFEHRICIYNCNKAGFKEDITHTEVQESIMSSAGRTMVKKGRRFRFNNLNGT